MQSSKQPNRTNQWRSVIQRIWGLFRLDNPQIGPVKTPNMIDILEAAWRDWQYAKNYFDSVTDPDLIDHAIFYMGATEKKYVYLLKQAREKGINIERFSFANRVG